MIACIDVYYRGERGPAVAACVVFAAWTDAEPTAEYTVEIAEIEPYVPGEFYKRELPCIVAVLDDVAEPIDAIVVDGHVWLDPAETRAGLGAHLHAALGGDVPVVGVAKHRYHTTPSSAEVLRGDSETPLYVTAAGIDASDARRAVAAMHGDYRMPTLLKRADSLCRGR